MKNLICTFVVSAGLIYSATACADGFALQANLGGTTPHFSGGSQTVTITPGLQNYYSLSTPSQFDGVYGLGLDYHWDFKAFSLSLGGEAYYMNTTVSGVNQPFINADSDYDTLNYTANGNSTALMLEPKFVWTAYSWQPYVLAGAGVAVNRFNDYTETATNPDGSARPTATPFSAQTLTNFAYEAGIGVQHPLSSNTDAPVLSLDYRYMNWGNAGLGDAQAANSNLSLGKLTTWIVSVGLAYPF